MSTYTYQANFGDKDSLNPGSPGKVIKGSDFDIEFVNIEQAVASKADLAGANFTGNIKMANLDVTSTLTVANLVIEGNVTGTIDGGTY